MTLLRFLQAFRKLSRSILAKLQDTPSMLHIVLAGYSASVLAIALSARNLLQVVSIPFLLFWPGYAIVVVGLPDIRVIEKIVLSFGLSVGIFVGLASAVRLAIPTQNGTVVAIFLLAFICLLTFGVTSVLKFRGS